MIRKAIIAVRRYWRETLAAIAPFVLFLPLSYLTSLWGSISMAWINNVEVMAWLAQVVGIGFVHLVFYLPNFAVSVIAGLAFGIVKTQRPIRLAWLFGIGMFVANGGVMLLMFEWYACLFHLGHVVLPVATTAAWLRLSHAKQPGRCQECDYDLTGNVSGTCPECGTAVTEP